MILQALVEYYESLLRQERIASPGWGKVPVSFRLDLDEEGRIIQLSPLLNRQKKGKKEVEVPQTLRVPQPVKRSVDIKSNFLCDNSTYIFGADEKGKPERSLKCHEACRELHFSLLEQAQSPAARAVIGFFKSWNPKEISKCPLIMDNWKELVSGGNILFFYDGRSVVEEEEIRRIWQEYYNRTDSANRGICMITGEKTSLAVLHPVIKGIAGAQAMGTSLVSFNAPAFCSYEKEQGMNASVGEYAAFAYAAALNELLSDREHKKMIGDTTVVYWAEEGDPLYQKVGAAAMFGTVEESGLTDQDLSMIFERLQRGEAVEVDEQQLDMEKHFYVLGLAPNAARLTVRFFMRDSFGSMLKNVAQHYQRLEIVKPENDKFPILPMWKLLSETVNKNAKDKSPLPQMSADTLKAVLTGGTYPASLINGVMMRIRAEHQVTRGRAATIKAYYLRNENKDCPKEVLQVELNDQCNHVPYTLGRLFAILEHIQQEANPGINTTIKDKYFNAAAATPAHTFPVLMNLAQKHLRKVKADKGEKLAGWFNSQIGELAELIGEEYPNQLNLPQQGSFQLGYYCQTQKRYQKKEEKIDE